MFYLRNIYFICVIQRYIFFICVLLAVYFLKCISRRILSFKQILIDSHTFHILIYSKKFKTGNLLISLNLYARITHPHLTKHASYTIKNVLVFCSAITRNFPPHMFSYIIKLKQHQKP